MAQWHKRVNANAAGCGFSLEKMKYFLFLFFYSGDAAKHGIYCVTALNTQCLQNSAEIDNGVSEHPDVRGIQRESKRYKKVKILSKKKYI